mgnify:CR=1 FL=1
MPSNLDRTVKLARRRLWLNRWLRVLGWSAAVAAAVYMCAILPDKLFSLSEASWYYPGVAVGAMVAGVLASVIWFFVTRESRHAAAAALDSAAGLKERISSGLFCAKATDPFARAVYRDAERISGSISPRSHLRVVFPRSGGYAIGMIALALLVSFAVPQMDLLGRQEQRVEEKKKEEPIRRTQVVVEKTMDRLKKMSAENPLVQKMDGLRDLETPDEAKPQSPLEVRQQAVKKIDSAIKSLQERQARSEEGRLDAVQKMLRRASDRQRGQDNTMEALNKALASGDFQSARNALQELQKKLGEEAKTPEQKQQAEAVRQQLASLADRLDKAAAAQQLDKKLAEQLEKAGINAKDIEKKLAQLSKEDIEKIAKQLEKQGVTPQQIQEAVKKLQDQSKACQSCKKLAQGLGSASKGVGAAAGAQGLQAADQQLSEMEQLQQEAEQLQMAMSELQNAKSDLGKPCSQCNGTGMCNGKTCSKCGGSGCAGGGNQPGAGGSGQAMGGLGRGQGGIAPEAETAFKTARQRSPVVTGPGTLIGQSWTNGEQVPGQATSEYREAAISAERDVAESIRQERVPRQYQKTMSKYFDRIARDAQVGAGVPATQPEGSQ